MLEGKKKSSFHKAFKCIIFRKLFYALCTSVETFFFFFLKEAFLSGLNLLKRGVFLPLPYSDIICKIFTLKREYEKTCTVKSE